MDKEDGKDKGTGKDKEVNRKDNVSSVKAPRIAQKVKKMHIRHWIISIPKAEEKEKASQGIVTIV